MTAGFMLMSLEILTRFSYKGRGTLIYLFKEDSPQNAQKSIAANAAVAAFRSLAQSIGREYAEKNFARILLAQGTNEHTDEELARWLFSYIDEYSRAQNAASGGSNKDGASSGRRVLPFFKHNAHNAVKWISCGAKPPLNIQLFKKRG
jgi:hypothetical protein